MSSHRRTSTDRLTMVKPEPQEEEEIATAAHVVATAAPRGVAFAASLAAAVLVVTNRQERWGINVNFTMFDVWEAFVATNFVCAAYSALTALLVKKLIGKCWLHHLDQFMVNLQTAATAGAGAVGSIAMWGNKPSGWFAVCRMYHRYCNVGAVALALSFVAFLSLGVACTLSRYPRTPAAIPEDTGRILAGQLLDQQLAQEDVKFCCVKSSESV